MNHDRSSLRFPAGCLAALLLAALTSLPAAARQDETPRSLTSPGSGIVEAIPTSAITTEADILVERLREAEAQVRPLRFVEDIAAQLGPTGNIIEEDRLNLTRMDTDLISLRQAEDMRARWDATRIRLAGWGRRLAKRAAALEETRLTLVASQLKWELTAEALSREDLPSALTTRVESILSELEQHELLVRRRLQVVLTLQNRVAELQASASAGLEQVEAWLELSRRQLLVADSPPLWERQARSSSETTLFSQLADSWDHDRTSLLSYMQQAQRQLLLHMAIFAGLVVLMLSLRRQSRRWKLEGEDLGTAILIINRPLSSAMLIGLLATPILYVSAPSVVFELNRLLYLIPVMRLLPGILGKRWTGTLAMLAGLYITDNIVDLALERSYLQRLLLLALIGLTLAAAWRLRNRLREPAEEKTPVLTAFFSHLLTPAMLLLAIALAANVLGYVNLAALITDATLTSAYLGISLVAVVQVLGALVSLALLSRTLTSLHSFNRNTELIRRQVAMVLRLAALMFWMLITVYFFGLLPKSWDVVTGALGATWTFGSLQLSLGSLLAFLATVWIAVLVSRLIRFILQEDVLPRMPLARGMDSSISLLIHYGILSLGFLLALSAAGIEMSKFAILAGALGVGIGFGLQNLVNNFVSGLILIFERPVQLGDRIQVGEYLGEVRRIGFRASTIRTLDGAEIIVPNGDLISREITNWTLSDNKRRVEIRVGVAYGTDPSKVLNLLREVAAGEPDALEDPEPRAYFVGFGDSSLNFALRFWTMRLDDWWGVNSKMTVGVNDALKAAGIHIPFPQRDLHLRSVDGQAAGNLQKPPATADAAGPGSPDSST